MSNYSLGYRGRALPFNHRHAGLISTLGVRWGSVLGPSRRYILKICGVKKNCMSYPSSRVLVYDHLSLVSLRLRGTRSRNKRACLLRFESADLSYLSLRRTPVVGALAPASSGLKDPVPGALSPHAPRCGARTGFPTGARENPPPQIACGRRSRLSSNVHTSRHEKRRYRAYVGVRG